MGTKETIGVRRLKNEASRILDEVREHGTDYVVTKRGRPVAVIRPWREDDERDDRVVAARKALAGLEELAGRVSAAANAQGGREGAAAAVSAQRR